MIFFFLFLYRNYLAQAILEKKPQVLQFDVKIINILAISQEADQQHLKKESLLQTRIHPQRLRSQFCYVLTRKHAFDYSKGKNHQESPHTFSCWFQCASLAICSIPASSKVS